MIYLIIAILAACVAGKVEVFSFGPKGRVTALLQRNASCIVIGTSKGQLGLYSPKGQLMGELASVHREEVVGIESAEQEGRAIVISADRAGTLAVWNEDGALAFSLGLQIKIMGISYSENSHVLAINAGKEVQLYSVSNFTRLGSVDGEGTFRKVHFAGRKLYYMLDGQQGSKICAFDCEEGKRSIITQKGSYIVDFAVGQTQTSQTTLIYLINSRNHLEILQLPADNHPNVQHASQQEQSLILQSNYTSVTSFRNNASLPIFAAIKSQSQLEFFTHTTISMFLQFNYDISLARSTFNNSLLLATQTDQVTLVKMYDHNDQREVWVIVFIVGMLAVGLYLCCGDCCPGIYEKYVADKERKEIELQLYKKRTELDNF